MPYEFLKTSANLVFNHKIIAKLSPFVSTEFSNFARIIPILVIFAGTEKIGNSAGKICQIPEFRHGIKSYRFDYATSVIFTFLPLLRLVIKLYQCCVYIWLGCIVLSVIPCYDFPPPLLHSRLLCNVVVINYDYLVVVLPYPLLELLLLLLFSLCLVTFLCDNFKKGVLSAFLSSFVKLVRVIRQHISSCYLFKFFVDCRNE